MKFIKYLIISLVSLLMLASCSTTQTGDAQQSSDSTTSQVSSEPISSDTDTDTQAPIGGDVDTLADYYHASVMGFTYNENTFLTRDEDKLKELVETWEDLYYYKSYENDEFPPVMVYLIEKLNATREEFVAYQASIVAQGRDVFLCTDEMIDALFSDDEAFRKRVLKSPYAVYADDGHIYSFRDLQDMTTAEIGALGLSEQEWADYIATVTPELPPMDSIDFLLPFAGDATPTTAPETSADPEVSESDAPGESDASAPAA